MHQNIGIKTSAFDYYSDLKMISDKLYQFAVSNKSVSSELAENPNQSPGEIVSRLFKHKQEAAAEASQHPTREQTDEADLQRAFECGNWGGQRPSNLFLKVRLDLYA